MFGLRKKVRAVINLQGRSVSGTMERTLSSLRRPCLASETYCLAVLIVMSIVSDICQLRYNNTTLR